MNPKRPLNPRDAKACETCQHWLSRTADAGHGYCRSEKAFPNLVIRDGKILQGLRCGRYSTCNHYLPND